MVDKWWEVDVARRPKPDPLGWPLIRLTLVVVVGGIAPLIDTTVVNVALHTIGASFHVQPDAVQWVATVYLLALAATVPVTTWASSRFGSRHTWIAGLALFFVGSGMCSLSWSFGALVGFRALQGVGAGIMLPLLQTILVRAAGPGKTGRVLTIMMLVTTIAPVAGPLVGGAIVTAGDWRLVFVINLPICVAAIALALRYLPNNTERKRTRLDVPGVLMLSGGMAALLFALSNAAADASDAAARIWVPLAIGLALTGAFIVWAHKLGDDAAVRINLFKDRNFAAVNAVLFFSGLTLYGVLFLLPLYFQQERGLSALAAGAFLTLQGLGSLLTRWVGGVVDRIGARLIGIVGLIVGALATVPFALSTAHTSYAVLAIALVVRGGALSAVSIAATTSAFVGLTSDQVPSGSAILRLGMQVGGSAGTALLATVLAATAASGVSIAFDTAFTWAIALTLATLIPCAMIPKAKVRR